MAFIKLKVDYYVEGVLHEAGKIHDMPKGVCQSIVRNNNGVYVEDPDGKSKPKESKKKADTESDSPATVTVKSFGRKRTVTEP